VTRERAYYRLRMCGFTRAQARAMADAGLTVFFVRAETLMGVEG
jgi:hypothetical protein